MGKIIGNLIKLNLSIIIMGAILLVRTGWAIELNLQLKPIVDDSETLKKIDDFIKANPFPDSAYTVELDETVELEGPCEEQLFEDRPVKIFMTDKCKRVDDYCIGTGNFMHFGHRKKDLCLKVLPKIEVNKQFFSDLYKLSQTIEGEEKAIIKAGGEKYIVPDKLINRIFGNSDNFTFHLYIRYEMKDEAGKIVQTYTTKAK